MKEWFALSMVALSVVILLSPCNPWAASPTAADFYKGKIVTIVVTGPPGSVNDIYGRVAALYLSEIIGAKVAVENKTAAGGLVAQNNFFQVVKPDGLTILCEATGRLWPGWLMGEKASIMTSPNLSTFPVFKGGHGYLAYRLRVPSIRLSF